MRGAALAGGMAALALALAVVLANALPAAAGEDADAARAPTAAAVFPAAGEGDGVAPGLRPPQAEGPLGLKPGEAAAPSPPLQEQQGQQRQQALSAPAPGGLVGGPGETGATVAPETGLASWYGGKFHQRRTASGERFDMHAMTAAHRTLAFGTMICVRSQVTGRAVVVRVNDRGPHAKGRIVDLSRAAAVELGLHGLGLKPVAVTPLAPGESACPAPKPARGGGD